MQNPITAGLPFCTCTFIRLGRPLPSWLVTGGARPWQI